MEIRCDGRPNDSTAPASSPVCRRSDCDVRHHRSGEPEERRARWLELALQHMFGDSGFGVYANVTLVDST
jgi:hypothetical protein